MIDENVINIGKKKVMDYVFSVVMLFNNIGYEDATIRARGNNINVALETAGLVVKKYVPGVQIDNVSMTFEEFDDRNKPGKKVYIPSIEIHIKKGEDKEYTLPEVSEDEVILVGKKEVKRYAVSAMTVLNNKGKVHIRARGRNAAKAAKAAAVLLKYLVPNAKLEKTEIGFSYFEGKNKAKKITPEIDIFITK